MSNKDFDHLTIMRTRTGPCQGDSTERQMLDAINDTGSFRTRAMIHPDGSQTRMKTKCGMPEFITDEVHTTTEETELTVYMESGQLEYTWPGVENPTASYAASWHFLNIATDGEYLGYIKYDAAHIGNQKNKPALSEGQNSLAVGYPPKADPAKDTASREAYAAATVSKKMMMSMFPASLYSGKMRKFIQAQYGAKEALNNPLGVKLSGTSFTLVYTKGDDELVLGLWAHNSPGIYTAADGTYWLLSVTTTEFSWYPIKQDKAGAALLKVYTSSTATDRDKLEAYIFAHSYVSLASKKTLSITGLPGGAPLAYGWKFDSTGAKASIVLHAQEGGYGSIKWRSYECHLSFSYYAGEFTVSKVVNDFGTWTDGWGAFNIFVPEYDIATRLWCNSIAMAPGVAPAFNFSGVHVYGYYIDDIWEPVVMSRSDVYQGAAVREETTSGMVFDSHVVFEDPTFQPNWQHGYYLRDASYELSYSTEKAKMNISFAGSSYNGEMKYGSHDDGTFHIEPVGGDLGLATPYGRRYLVTQYGTGTFDGGASAPGWSAIIGAPEYTFPTDGFTDYVSFTHAQITNTSRTYSGYKVNNSWALVIPGLDAEAVYIPHREFHASATTGTKTTTISWPIAWWIQTAHAIGPLGDGSLYDLIAYTPTLMWIVADDPTITTEPPPTSTAGVACSNTEIINAAGVPAYSYSAIFTVDKTYPYYDPGMFFFTSYGGRYIGSEGIKSPNSVRSQDRFVGWA